jgi:hypothetical protein
MYINTLFIHVILDDLISTRGRLYPRYKPPLPPLPRQEVCDSRIFPCLFTFFRVASVTFILRMMIKSLKKENLTRVHLFFFEKGVQLFLF